MILTNNSAIKWKKSFKWHNWFAWHPVFLDNHIVWLEWIKRRRSCSWYEITWDYRLK